MTFSLPPWLLESLAATGVLSTATLFLKQIITTGGWGKVFSDAANLQPTAAVAYAAGWAMASAVGFVFISRAFESGGKAATVNAVVSLSTLIVAVLAWALMNETLSFKEWAGLTLAIVAVAILAF